MQTRSAVWALVLSSSAGALVGGCSSGQEAAPVGLACCAGQGFVTSDSVIIPSCFCQPVGSLDFGGGVSTTLTVSGDTCSVAFTGDGGTNRLTGAVVASCSSIGDGGGPTGRSGDGLPEPPDDAGSSGQEDARASDGIVTLPEASAPDAAAPEGGLSDGSLEGGPRVLGCAPWQLLEAPGTTATASITNGVLLLQRPQPPSRIPVGPIFNAADLALVQSGLTGDFDVTVTWRNFQPGGGTPFLGPNVQAGIWWTDPSGGADRAMAEVGQGAGFAAVNHGQTGVTNSLNALPSAASLLGAAGSFHIVRSASVVTVTTTVSDLVATAQSTEPFPEQPLQLFLSINDADGVGSGTASIEITGVTVVGGGGAVRSDDFSCTAP